MSASKHRLYFLLQLTAHRLKKRADAALIGSGSLTTAQAAAMSIIASEGPVTQCHIAQKLSQRESAITPMANRLVKAGYISKAKSKADGRAWELSVTRTGLAALKDMKKTFDKINHQIEQNLSTNDIEKLADSLKNILSALDGKRT